MVAASSLEALLDLLLANLAALVVSISAEANPLPRAQAVRVIANHRQQVQDAMLALGEWIIDFEASRPNPQAAKAARHKLTAPLHSWAQTGPTHAHARRSSAAKHESFELVEVLEQQTAAGADIPALIFDDFLLYAPMSQAFMAHMGLFTRQLHQEASVRVTGERAVRMLSLHYSGGTETRLLAEDPALAGRVQLTCVDGSSESLRDAQQKLSRPLRRRISCERREPLRYVEEPRQPSDSFHIVYSVSIFDVMSTGDVIALVCGMHRLLRPGGVLLGGNATTTVPAWEVALRRWWLGWELQLRNEAMWQAIAARTPFGKSGLQCIPEPSGIGLIIRGEKTE